MKDQKPLLILLLVTFLSTIFIWYAFYFNLPRLLGFPATRLETIYANYDGPNYLAIVRCGYKKDCLAKTFSLPLPLEYYPAHLPGYPLIIKYFDLITTGLKAILLATLAGSLFLTYAAFNFFKLFLDKQKSFYLTLVFLFFPARLFILRLIGAPETWFIAFILASITAFKQKKYLPSALFAAAAQLLKSPAIILFAVYGLLALIDLKDKQKLNKNYLYYLLIPATALAIFGFYYLQTSDFLAYFHSGDNIHLTLLPFSVFVSNRSWIQTIWLEDIIYLFFLVFVGLKLLYQKYKLNITFLFPFVFTLAAVFVAHRDLSRYITPVYPFILLAFSGPIYKHRRLFLLILPAIILYAINFLIGNTTPIADWTPYL